VIVGDLVSAEDATRVVEDLLSALRKPLAVEEYPIDVTASLGSRCTRTTAWKRPRCGRARTPPCTG